MTRKYWVALAFATGVALNVPSFAAPHFVPAYSPTKPPLRINDCVTYALLDDKCTADWYKCSSAGTLRNTCVRAWEDCCTLPGNAARTTIVTAPQSP